MSNPIAEARIAVESAIAVADLVAQTDIVQSQSFNQLVAYLHDAVEALAKAETSKSLVSESEPATREEAAGGTDA